jgi:Outer membrane protein beta-barrel domain
MARIRFAVLASLLTAVFVLPAPAAAQDDHGDYFGGVNAVNRVLNRGESTTYSPGWFAGAAYRVTHAISVTGEVAADYRDENGTRQHITTFSGGVRFQSGARAAKLRPFALILMGTGMDDLGTDGATNHYPVVTPGGGVDVRLADHVAARVKLDFPLYATFGDVHKGARVAFGLSVPVGTR